ncbi:hydroxypyruvate isomerase family protein [Marinicrinis lubricantis]|uniref:Hydroxypyruvate isomerase family protein n=1 Tax=Marinicrinis lubricantis TaxID=2086470 RepID=A0ABW1IVZ6_9BACL
MKFSVCIDALFRHENLSLEEQLKRVKESGYEAFEFWSWWDKDLHQIKELKQQLGLHIACFCTKFESLTDALRRPSYLQGLKDSIEAAQALGCSMLITQAGSLLPGVPRHELLESLVTGLKEADRLLEHSGITLVLEPLNTRVDHPGYALDSSLEALQVLDEVGSSRIKVLFDAYHQQVMGEDIISIIRTHHDRIGAYHIADAPGRHEIGSGEMDIYKLLEAIQKTGYDRYVGLEYFPLHDAAEGLSRFYRTFGSFERL